MEVSNYENLTPLNTRSEEERKKIATMGGKASGRARREKKLMKDIVLRVLDMPMKSGRVASLDDIASLEKAKGKNLTVQEMIILAQVKNALKGDKGAIEFLRDTSGQALSNKVDITANVPVMFAGEGELVDDEKDNQSS